MGQQAAKGGLYVLLVVVGAVLGLIAGGETIRHIYGVKSAASLPDTVSGQTGASAVPGRNATSGEDASLSRENAIVRATRVVAPCVVGIVVTQIQVVHAPYSDDFFDFFFGPEMLPRFREAENIGSGFVIRDDGMILTNYHVVQNAAKLYVNFSDGRRIEGKIVGADEHADIAVISVNGGGNYRSIKFGNSDNAMIGEWAIAIGNPFLTFINDAHPTVTVGVVSALNRNFAPAEGVYYQGMVQTDAAINPGNSGGPLVNAAGEVIGINTFIYTGSNSNKGSIGIGFAIPINRARRAAEELIAFGHRRDIWTGIAVQNIERSIAQAIGYKGSQGVVIVNVARGSPGETSGARVGDIIEQIGNRRVRSHGDLDGFFLDYYVGDMVHMDIIRNGSRLSLPLVLREAPQR